VSSRSISVVIPTVGRRDLVVDTLRSVLGQTRAADEVIVVLDGDSDGTQRMLEQRFPSVRCVPTRSADAAFGSRRAGVAAARGDWVAFLDDDDLWHRQFLAQVEAHLDAHAGCGAVRAAFYVFATDAAAPDAMFGLRRDVVATGLDGLEQHAARHAPVNDFGYLDIAGHSLAAMLERNRGAILTSVVRRDILLDLPGLPEPLRTNGDWLMLTDVAARTEWCLLDGAWAFYRVHAGQHSSDPTIPRDTARALRLQWQRHGRHAPVPLERYRRRYLDRVQEMAWAAVRGGRPQDVPGIVRDGWAVLPRASDRLAALVPYPVAVRWRGRRG
jgi:glycosyltransferase involved in cell wall biosynthesis